MSRFVAEQLATRAQNHAVVAINTVQQGGITTEDEQYREAMAMAVANLSQAFVEFLNDRPLF